MSRPSSGQVLPLELDKISFRYGRNVVLRGVDLRLQSGEIVALLGANGAGKTTLFSLMCGLAHPDGGVRSFAGKAVDDVHEGLRASLAHLGHRPQVYPLLTARENLKLFADLRRATGGSSTGEGDAYLRRLGLGDVLDRPVSTFSRGMAQRVALARALAQQPELLVLDEPFTALDPAGRALLGDILKEQRERGACVFLASHDIESVSHVADRALLLIDGVIARELRLDESKGDGARAHLRYELAHAMAGPRVQAVGS